MVVPRREARKGAGVLVHFREPERAARGGRVISAPGRCTLRAATTQRRGVGGGVHFSGNQPTYPSFFSMFAEVITEYMYTFLVVCGKFCTTH